MSNLKIQDVATTILDNINYEVSVADTTLKYNGKHLKRLENRVKLYGSGFLYTPKQIIRYKVVDDKEFEDMDDCIIENMLCATCKKIKDRHFGKREHQQWLVDIIELIQQICQSTDDSDGEELCGKVHSDIIEQDLSGVTVFEVIKNLPCVRKYIVLYSSLNEVLDY